MLTMSRTFSRRALVFGLLAVVLGGVSARLLTSWLNDTAHAAPTEVRTSNVATPYIGVVVDDSGQPISSATVVARWSDGRTRETTTDRFGRYVVMVNDDVPSIIDARIESDRFLTGRRVLDTSSNAVVVVSTHDLTISNDGTHDPAVAFDDGQVIAYDDASITPSVLQNLAAKRSGGDVVIRTGGSLTLERDSTIRLPGHSLRLRADEVAIAGRIDVAGHIGGSVTIEGDVISVDGTIDASGDHGGGVIQLGGGWQGAGGFAPASRITVSDAASIDAGARYDGDGGTIVLWADPKNPSARVVVQGSLSARGGRFGGDGGRIETSGPLLDIDGIDVDTVAPAGAYGTWLVDPRDISISESADADISFSSGTYTSSSSSAAATLSATTLSAALESGNVTVSTTGSGSMSGTITVSAEIAAGGTTTLTLVADSSVVLNAPITRTSTGDVTITATSGGLSGSGNLDLSGGDLTITQGGDSTYRGAISGAGTTVTKLGAGTLTVSGLSTNTGSTTISAGTLKLGGKDKWSDDTAVAIASGAALDLASFNETIGSLAGAGDVTLGSASFTVGGDNSSTTYSGVMSGTGRLTKTGNGVMTLSGANTYTGVTTVSAGTLRLGAADRLSNATALVVDSSATFDLNDFDETVSSISNTLGDSTISLGTATLTTSGSASSTYAGTITGQGGLTKAGSGTLTIEGSLTYVGTTTISAGTLQLSGSGQLSDSTA
ncbi:MAG: hypothetical protein EBT21_03700, partial [Actinobacteria bacterium]|nr:hypothetical protein [Actinomycetota bacterium]